ncbi:hypothetical protein GGX14DRAFT_388915 [Mycena pura]|uniref:Uncharacterized protein n=1 Tax=Mycena pura TaxID=153505 RepID=A0AAD6YIU8_9AGAR|nr:hypothetical protein GGX14DRAFT_388915 [Mycena pura]
MNDTAVSLSEGLPLVFRVKLEQVMRIASPWEIQFPVAMKLIYKMFAIRLDNSIRYVRATSRLSKCQIDVVDVDSGSEHEGAGRCFKALGKRETRDGRPVRHTGNHQWPPVRPEAPLAYLLQGAQEPAVCRWPVVERIAVDHPPIKVIIVEGEISDRGSGIAIPLARRAWASTRTFMRVTSSQLGLRPPSLAPLPVHVREPWLAHPVGPAPRHHRVEPREQIRPPRARRRLLLPHCALPLRARPIITTTLRPLPTQHAAAGGTAATERVRAAFSPGLSTHGNGREAVAGLRNRRTALETPVTWARFRRSGGTIGVAGKIDGGGGRQKEAGRQLTGLRNAIMHQVRHIPKAFLPFLMSLFTCKVN